MAPVCRTVNGHKGHAAGSRCAGHRLSNRSRVAHLVLRQLCSTARVRCVSSRRTRQVRAPSIAFLFRALWRASFNRSNLACAAGHMLSVRTGKKGLVSATVPIAVEELYFSRPSCHWRESRRSPHRPGTVALPLNALPQQAAGWPQNGHRRLVPCLTHPSPSPTLLTVTTPVIVPTNGIVADTVNPPSSSSNMYRPGPAVTRISHPPPLHSQVVAVRFVTV